ncbi:trigger factor [Agilicoccus flavus]|uniref:trigger factor n=1 Tax=Agilicoccus flavus TaxID=2775968 RepID=UPI001CF6BBF7|nr:trigger factor [Agilicoccus flavus]
MKSAVETLNPTRVKLTVEVPNEELRPSIDAAVKSIGSQISIPGFRPGKVPARIIEQRVGKGAVLQEAVNQALPDLYGQALAENEIRPLGQPEIDVTEVPAQDGEQLVFTAEVDVRPEITLPAFDEIEVSVDSLDDAAVAEESERRMTELRERFGTLVGVDRAAAEGDFVSMNLRGEIGGEEIDAVEGVSYEIGSRTMLEGLDEALTGLSADESTTFEAPLAGGDHEGENAHITVTVSAVKTRELPELDDDFAQMASEFDTLAELEESVREQARQAKTFEQGVQARDKVLEHLLESLDIPVPESIVEAEVTQHLQGENREDDDEHRAEVQESTRRALRTQLLLDTIAEANEVEVTQQELIEYLIASAQQYGMDPSEFARAIDEGNQVSAMAGEVARRKALASILEKVTVRDAAGELVDLNAETIDDGMDEDVDDDLEGDAAEVVEVHEESAPEASDADETSSK